jgi:hypothetical protein
MKDDLTSHQDSTARYATSRDVVNEMFEEIHWVSPEHAIGVGYSTHGLAQWFLTYRNGLTLEPLSRHFPIIARPPFLSEELLEQSAARMNLRYGRSTYDSSNEYLIVNVEDEEDQEYGFERGDVAEIEAGGTNWHLVDLYNPNEGDNRTLFFERGSEFGTILPEPFHFYLFTWRKVRLLQRKLRSNRGRLS